MGRYRNNRCGTCYNTGHNKRSCPVETQNLRNTLNRYMVKIKRAEDSVDHSYSNEYLKSYAQELGQQIAARTGGVDPYTGKKPAKGAVGSTTRQCSYCRFKDPWDATVGLGHTRRTCAHQKSDIATAQRVNHVYRAGVLRGLREAGVGVGALISAKIAGYFGPNQTYGHEQTLFIVMKIDWDSVNFKRSTKILEVQRMNCLNDRRRGAMRFGAPMLAAEGDTSALDGTNDNFRALSFVESNGGEWISGKRNVYGGWSAKCEPNADGHLGGRYIGRNVPKLVGPIDAARINPPANWLTEDCADIARRIKQLKAAPKKADR